MICKYFLPIWLVIFLGVFFFFFLREVVIEIIVDSHLETSLGTGGCVFSSEAPIFIMSTFKRSLKTVERLF